MNARLTVPAAPRALLPVNASYVRRSRVEAVKLRNATARMELEQTAEREQIRRGLHGSDLAPEWANAEQTEAWLYLPAWAPVLPYEIKEG